MSATPVATKLGNDRHSAASAPPRGANELRVNLGSHGGLCLCPNPPSSVTSQAESIALLGTSAITPQDLLLHARAGDDLAVPEIDVIANGDGLRHGRIRRDGLPVRRAVVRR